MEKLNELVELANNATPGPWKAATDWERAAVYSTSKDEYPENKRVVCSGNQNNHKRFNAEPWSGSDWNDAAFIAAANPSAILAIAEAFRDMERNLAEVRQYNLEYAQREVELEQRAEAAEAKLAELAKLEPYGYVAESPCSSGYGGMMYEFSIDRRDAEHDANQAEGFVIELFTRPAPAAELADIFPEDLNGKSLSYIADKFQVSISEAQFILVGFNACCTAMLRNIEGAK